MKKSSIAVAFAVIAIAAFAEYKVFISKNTSETSDFDVPVTQSYFQSADIQNDSVITNAGSVQLKFEYSGVSASDTDYRSVARQMLDTLDHIEKISQCSAKCNKDITEEYNSTTYYKVVDRTFKSLSDVSSYLSMTLTEDLINERYSEITNGPSPVLIEKGSCLYTKTDREPGKGFEWEKDENGSIVVYVSDTSSEGFTVNSTGHTIEFVNENNIWKIKSVN